LVINVHREGEGACRSGGDEISDLVTLEGPREFMSQDCVEGAGFISTPIHLKSSDGGIERLEKGGLAHCMGDMITLTGPMLLQARFSIGPKL